MRSRIALLACIFAVFGCGGGNSALTTYTVAGTVDHLSSPGLTLTNGTTTIGVTQDATRFAFPNQLANGTAYQISVASQPANENCVISQGGGTVSHANVSDVDVACNTVISTPTAVGIYPVVTGSDGYAHAYVPVTMVGNNPVKINATLDTASAGVVLNAFDVIPSSAVSINGFNFPAGHSTISYNGITVTNKVMSTYLNGQGAGINLGLELSINANYSTNGPPITATGNLAYAQVTFGSGGAVTTAVIPILLIYRVSTSANGVALPSTVGSNVFGVSGMYTPIGPLTGTPVDMTSACTAPPGSSNVCALISPLISVSFSSDIDPGFVLAPLSLQNCQIGAPGSCTAVPSLTVGVNATTIQALGFNKNGVYSTGCGLTMTYATSGFVECIQYIWPTSVMLGNNLGGDTAVLLDSGNSGMTLGTIAGNIPSTIAAGTQVTVQFGIPPRYDIFDVPTYSFTAGAGIYTTTTVPASELVDLGIGFFTTHWFYIDYKTGTGWV